MARKIKGKRGTTETMPAYTGAQIRQAREARGLSVVELAKKAKVGRQALTDWEKGTRTPHGATVRKVMKALAAIPLLPDIGLPPAAPKE